jgi:hypothetical protein
VEIEGWVELLMRSSSREKYSRSRSIGMPESQKESDERLIGLVGLITPALQISSTWLHHRLR